MQHLVEVEHLSVTYQTDEGEVQAVRDVTLDVGSAEIVGVVGESGSGKSTVATAILGLLDPSVAEGRVNVAGRDVFRASRRELQKLRRHEMATILQDPVGSLNPVRKIRSQLHESAAVSGIERDERLAEIEKALDDVGLEAEKVLGRYPHELSGGMNQRVAIAMALLKEPRLLIADEPTSALDVRTQVAIMQVLQHLRARRGMSILIVTHDLDLALGNCDRVAVMYRGELVEFGTPEQLEYRTEHPYTRALLDASPHFGDTALVRPIDDSKLETNDD